MIQWREISWARDFAGVGDRDGIGKPVDMLFRRRLLGQVLGLMTSQENWYLGMAQGVGDHVNRLLRCWPGETAPPAEAGRGAAACCDNPGMRKNQPPTYRIAPSILSADFARLGEEIKPSSPPAPTGSIST
jgi:hypothetical protein